MKTTFGLVFAALFVSAVLSAQLNTHSPQLPLQLLPGQSTVYAYSGRLVSGQAGDSAAAAVLEIKADIVLQAEESSAPIQGGSAAPQQKVALQMTNIRVGKHAGQAPDHSLTGRFTLEHQEAPEYAEALSAPIRFIWAAGQVKSFEASAAEPEWSINIKKAILSLLNVNLHPTKVIQSEGVGAKIEKQNGIHRRQQIQVNPAEQMVVYPLYEDGIGGICETLYEVKQAPYTWAITEEQQARAQHVLNITKTRIYDNCLTAPVLEKSNVDIRGAPVGCRAGRNVPLVAGYYPMGAEAEYQATAYDQEFQSATIGACAEQQAQADKAQQKSPVSQFNFVRYNISKHLEAGIARIDSIYAEGKTILDSSAVDKKIMVIVQQNVTLKTVQPFAEVIQPVAGGIVHSELSFRLPKQTQHQTSSQQQTLDMPYFQLFGQVPTSELKKLIPELLNSLAADIAAAEDQLASGANNGNTLQKAVELQNAMAVLDIDSLEQIFTGHATAGRSPRATAQQHIVRKLFLDLVGSAGSTDSALLAIRLYSQDKLTSFEAKELFESVPQNLFLVDVAVVEQYLNAFLSEKVQADRHLASSMGIAIGKLVHEAVVKRGQQQLTGDIHSEEAVMRGRRAQEAVQANENIGFMNAGQSYQAYQQAQPQKTSFRAKMMQQSQGIHHRIRRSAPWESNFRQELLQEQEQLDTILSVLATALRQAPTFHQKVTLIETLAHTSLPQVLQILAPYVNDQAPLSELPGYTVEDREQVAEERNFIRQVTIYALAHVARQHPSQVLALLMPVYENKAEPYEVRIAAFTIAINCRPSRAELERIAAQLHSESNRQIRSFVTSALHTAANATQTGWEEFAADARLAAQMAPTKEPLGLHYSKMVGEGYYNQKSQQGLHYIAEWVSSNVSAVPRSAYFQIGQQSKASAMKNVLFEVGYNAKGVEQLLQRVMEPNGIVSDAFEAMSASQTGAKDRRILSKRSAVDSNAQQALQSLKDKLNLVIRTSDEPKATIFFKLFERTSYYALDRHYLHSVIDQAEDRLKDLASSLMAGRSAHYVKLVMPAQTVKVVPSELGLPVVVTTRHPTILSVKVAKAKLQLDMPKSAILPVGANLTVQVVPALFHADYDFIFALAPIASLKSSSSNEAIGTHVDRTTRAAFPVELSFGFKRNKLAWSVVPAAPQEIFHQHVATKAFIAPATVASSPDRDWLEASSVEIKSKRVPFAHEQSILKEQLGLGLRVQVQSESVEAIRPLSAHFYSAMSSAKRQGPFVAIAEALVESATATAPREVHIVLEADQEKQVTGYDFALAYKRVEDLDGKVVMSRAEIAEIEADQENDIITEEDIAAMGKTTKRNAWAWAARAVAQKQQQNSETEQLMAVSQAPTTEQVWEKLFNGQKFARQSVKNVARDLLASTAPVWTAHWAQTAEEQAKMEREIAAGVASASGAKMPAIIAHDIVLTAVARSAARPTYYGANLLVVRSFDDRTFWTKVNAFARKESISSYAKSAAHAHKELCFDGVLSYPVLPSEFYYEPQASANLQAKMHARIAFGIDCSQPSEMLAKITINGLMEKTDEKVLKRTDLATAAHLTAATTAPEAWFYEQCAVDQAAGQPQSYACERAIIEDAYFKQYQMEIDYQNIPAPVQNWTRKLALATKVALYEHLQLNEALDEQPQLKQNAPNKVRITAQFSTKFSTDARKQLANLYISTPKENAAYEKITLPSSVRPLSALLPLSEVYSNAIQQYEAVDRCIVMEGAIRTFDNVTIKVDEEQQIQAGQVNQKQQSWSQQQCQYLVAKDCSAAERFAVFARNLDADAKTKAVTVFIGATEIRLLPPTKSSQAAQAVVDGRTVQLRADQPEIVAKAKSMTSSGSSKDSAIVLTLRQPRSAAAEPIIVLEAPTAAALTVLYDGKTIKVELAGRGHYQGRTCGLCGDNNDEAEAEFTGPDACVYQRAADYIASYALAGAHCEQAPIAAGPKRCPTKVAKTQMPYIPAEIKVQNKFGNSGYVDLKEAAQKAKAARAAQIQAQANAEELARLNQAQMEAVMSRSPASNQFAGYPQYAGQQLPATPTQQQLLQRLRTYFVHQGADKVCFSIEPAMSCIEGVSRPAQQQQTLLNFHCLPAHSISVQRLTVQAATSVLPQFGRKVAHYSQYVQVPTLCVAN